MNKERGASLVEILLVITMIGIIVALIANIPNALMLINKSKQLSLAREIAVKQIEDKRTINYDNLSLGSSLIDDNRLSLLPQGSGKVEVGLKNEETEDPDDWIPCSSTTCPSAEDVKEITVIVDWVFNNKPQSVSLKTIISKGGINQ